MDTPRRLVHSIVAEFDGNIAEAVGGQRQLGHQIERLSAELELHNNSINLDNQALFQCIAQLEVVKQRLAAVNSHLEAIETRLSETTQ